jgi:hypothetical protein
MTGRFSFSDPAEERFLKELLEHLFDLKLRFTRLEGEIVPGFRLEGRLLKQDEQGNQVFDFEFYHKLTQWFAKEEA